MSTSTCSQSVPVQQTVPRTTDTGTHNTSHVSGELCAQNPQSRALWTDGLPDREKIKQRMEQLGRQFAARPAPSIEPGRFFHQRYIWQMMRAQSEFYAELFYLDSLLCEAPVLPLPVAQSTTTVVTPYVPRTPRRRGRPSTGGRRPRDRRRNPPDDAYV